MQLGLLKIQLATGRAADEQAGETTGLVQRFHEEGFRSGEAVEEDVRQRVAVIDLHRHLHPLDRRREARDALAHRQPLTLAADVLALQRHTDDLGGGDDAGVEQLQHHPIPLRAGGTVKPLALAGQLARGGTQADRRLRKALRYLPGDLIQIHVRRDETGNVGRVEAQGGELLGKLVSRAEQARRAAGLRVAWLESGERNHGRYSLEEGKRETRPLPH